MRLKNSETMGFDRSAEGVSEKKTFHHTQQDILESIDEARFYGNVRFL